MGCFSWKTSDTKRSIPAAGSEREPIPVFLVVDDGRYWFEENYEGYGVFGGKDIFELIAELNGMEGRLAGIELCSKYKNFAHAADAGRIMPKLFECLPCVREFHRFPYPEDCEFQGWFYQR